MEDITIYENLTDLMPLNVGQIVAYDYRTADVFKKNNIDFCCGGKASLFEACTKKNINPDTVAGELIKVLAAPSLPSQNFNIWEPGFLTDYIVNTHHNYVRISVDILNAYLQKLVKVHGERHPELGSIQAYFISLTNELLPHIEKEETVLFPFIRQLVEKGRSVLGVRRVSLEGPIACMEQEHDYAGKIMQTISKLSNNYTPPDDACTTYSVCYMKLKEFETDLLQHIHLENNILFPKALALLEEEDAVPEPASCSIPINLHAN
ncbi:iron-sulfur cluster repair di-iron protein [Oscillatoria amoena NRMC-F 0135]|nr:iron-sulfur cluster repair di-iron protein [Oscillatoria amoena NRMC-F 0135]